jgi:hypothetical protein
VLAGKIMIRRRSLLTAAGVALVTPAKAQMALLLNNQIAASGGSIATTIAASGGTTAWPGQAGNPVGYAAAPGYPGALTPHAATGFASNTTYSFLDIDGGTTGIDLSSLTNTTFIGCRFQGNAQYNYNVNAAGTNLTFSYCTVCPRTAFVTSPPGLTRWPCAGAGQNTTTFSDGVNCTPGTQGYQYGFHIMSGGPVTISHCDIWGFGNAIDFLATTTKMLVDGCWIHDAANAAPSGYRTDGPGYLNGATPPQNVRISNCTIASLGNSNGLAWQAATANYVNIVMTGNYISGFGYTTAHFQPGSGGARNCQFVNNILGTDVMAIFGPIYSNPSSIYNNTSLGNLWRGNKLKVCEGTTYNGTTAIFQFTAEDDGKYIYPDSTLNATTDYAG